MLARVWVYLNDITYSVLFIMYLVVSFQGVAWCDTTHIDPCVSDKSIHFHRCGLNWLDALVVVGPSLKNHVEGSLTSYSLVFDLIFTALVF